MIIQCPSCQTKFSLATEILETAKNPRFHCSRCDNLFHYDDAGSEFSAQTELADTGETQTTSDSSTDTANDLATVDESPASETTTEGTQLDLITSGDIPTGPPERGHFFERDLDETMGTSITAAWPNTAHDEPHEADMSHLIKEHLSEPLENRPTTWAAARAILTREPESPVDVDAFTPVPKSEPTPSQLTGNAVWNSAAIETGTQESTPGSINDRLDDSAFLDDEEWTCEDTMTEDILNHGSFDEESLIPPTETFLSISSLAKTAFASSVPLAVCFALWLGGMALQTSPEITDSILSLKSDPLLTPPPTGVEVQALQPSFTALDNGQEVLELTGSVANKTGVNFDTVKIHAQIFDSNNVPLDSIIVYADNALRTVSRLSSLKTRDIEQLQEQRELGNRGLVSDRSEPFRLVFSQGVDKARWFSATIYSVAPPQEI